ncbi:hypothetical protein [Mucilaginibacter sp.]|uniref:hypothetical protein n=1 Tax=Mucilaginibacter sp. TaxID=1882438 RepID=UPI00261502DD|nr:hypothetical protein [Mucilaginibacter sp.]
MQPEVFPDLQRKGLVRQRSLFADLIYSSIVCFIGIHEVAALSFCYFLIKQKVMEWALAAKSITKR